MEVGALVKVLAHVCGIVPGERKKVICTAGKAGQKWGHGSTTTVKHNVRFWIHLVWWLAFCRMIP